MLTLVDGTPQALPAAPVPEPHADGPSTPPPPPGARPGGRPAGAGPAVGWPELLTITQAAVVLGVPTGWLRKKVTDREVPHTRLGKHVRFTAEHLRAIVAAGEQPTATVTGRGEGRPSARARRHLR